MSCGEMCPGGPRAVCSQNYFSAESGLPSPGLFQNAEGAERKPLTSREQSCGKALALLLVEMEVKEFGALSNTPHQTVGQAGLAVRSSPGLTGSLCQALYCAGSWN